MISLKNCTRAAALVCAILSATPAMNATSILSTVATAIQANPKKAFAIGSAITASVFYFYGKERKGDAIFTPEVQAARWSEIKHFRGSSIDRLKLLISYVDDYYVFGRSAKVKPAKIKMVDKDGYDMTVSDVKVLIKGFGPLNWIDKNIVSLLKETITIAGNVGVVVLALDKLSGGDVPWKIEKKA